MHQLPPIPKPWTMQASTPRRSSQFFVDWSETPFGLQMTSLSSAVMPKLPTSDPHPWQAWVKLQTWTHDLLAPSRHTCMPRAAL